ncbi:MAG: 23S rRNA (adenine(2503)-C(2))-methyltransferase RlmN [Candidatus Makana argininalis]
MYLKIKNKLFNLKYHNNKSKSKIKKINILDMNKDELINFFLKISEKSFRAMQIMKLIYHNQCNNFDEMNINSKLKLKLKKIAEIKIPKIIKQYISIDNTIKWIIQIDDQQIETVYIPEKNRSTLCISSQIGCALKCSFCATAKQGFNRNLRTSEIIGQILIANKFINLFNLNKKKKITNIVIMGMGEPLLNFNNIKKSIEIMVDSFGFFLSRRKITISTSGIVPVIKKLHDMNISLAVSLHASNDTIRNKIMPINIKYNIASLISSIKTYIKKSKKRNKRITIEYIMINGVNDKIIHAYQLVKLLHNINCIINIIPFNSFPGSKYKCSSKQQINSFYKILINYGIITIIRKIRGYDINASCGQLIGKITNRIKI